MKKLIGRLIAGLSVVAIGLMIAGRRQTVEVNVRPRIVSGDLDAELARAEARFDDIIPGAEKKIVWADSSRRKTPYSIVYLHGFSATRQETAPLSDRIAAALGANLYYTRLSGHGRTTDAMGEPHAEDWLDDAMEAYDIGRQIGERVILIGTSTGATLATWLAGTVDPDTLAAVVLLSPNFWPQAAGIGLVLWPGGRQLLHLLRGDYIEWEPSNEAHGTYWTNRYPSSSIVEMMRLVDLVDRMDLQAIKTPLLVAYCPKDQVVDPAATRATFERFGGEPKHLVEVDDVGDPKCHVLAGDILSPDDTDRVAAILLDFLRQIVPA